MDGAVFRLGLDLEAQAIGVDHQHLLRASGFQALPLGRAAVSARRLTLQRQALHLATHAYDRAYRSALCVIELVGHTPARHRRRAPGHVLVKRFLLIKESEQFTGWG